MTRQAILNQVEYLARRLKYGCGNGGCKINPPTGMHTNMICDCTPSKFASQFLGLSLELEEMGREWPNKPPAGHAGDGNATFIR